MAKSIKDEMRKPAVYIGLRFNLITEIYNLEINK